MSAARARSAPEVIQTSAMDCGPAALKCMLEGFGIPASYGRLRDACQTSVDGTSIDELERVGRTLGLNLEQVMLPVDHLLEESAGALPALVVVMLPHGMTHFVVVWRRAGRWLQVMDPASGRRWVPVERLLADTYVHEMHVSAEDWREYAGGESFGGVMRARLRRMAVSHEPLLAEAYAHPDWRGIAALDAASRLTASLAASGAVRRGPEASRLVAALAKGGRDPRGALAVIPRRYWSAYADDGAPEGTLALRGAVLLRAAGRSEPPGEASALPAELDAIRRDPPARAMKVLLSFAREAAPAAVAIALALVVAAAAATVEALAFRGLVDAYHLLGLPLERAGATAAFVTLLAILLATDYATTGGIRRLGRHLEATLRLRLLLKLPRLGDRYFLSRPVSDMTGRAHAISTVATFPLVAGQLLRTAAELVVTAAAIALFYPPSAPVALAAALAAVVVPLAAQRQLADQDLRLRTHGGALSRFYLDALLGAVPVRAHAAEQSVRREHEALLVEWARAGRALETTAIVTQAIQGLIGAGIALALVMGYLARHRADSATALLVVYWSLALPVMGAQIAALLQQIPAHRNTTLRLLEIVSAPEEEAGDDPAPESDTDTARVGAAGIELRGTTVVVAGHEVLRDVSLAIAPGSHVAIVGGSGAGKSTLLGVLLGWHRPSSGEIRVDGMRLDPERLTRLREQIAWVDPAVQLWNRSLVENLRYGAPEAGAMPLESVVDIAELRDVLAKLPDGMQTALGEGGGLVSGGEGQRARLGRALARRDASLVLLDEPFRGLDRPLRRELLRRARALWRNSTLLCVTHDIEHALEFEAVAVMESGRIVEAGPPALLAERAGSRFRAMIDSERRLREGLWAGRFWQRLRVHEGRVSADAGPQA